MKLNESKLMSILNQISELSPEEMLVINKGLRQMYKDKSRTVRLVASVQFSPGQVVKFHKSGRGRNAGTHYIKIERFNRAGTCVVGYPCSPEGEKISDYTKWTVSTTSCTLVK